MVCCTVGHAFWIGGILQSLLDNSVAEGACEG